MLLQAHHKLFILHPKSSILKIPAILAQYFYENNRIDLPGFGSFFFAPDADAGLDTRRNKTIPSGQLSFESNTSLKDNKELVNYISAQSGKMKSLAEADFNTHLETAKQFLSIGKPFLFEGIGSLVKLQSGEFALAAEQIAEKFRDVSVSEKTTGEDEAAFSNYRNILKPSKQKMSWRKPVLFLLIAGGLALAVWGGYKVYKITTSKNKEENTNKEKQVVQPETSIPSVSLPTKDSSNTINPTTEPISTSAENTYKFVVEVANKERALSRFKKLQTFGVKGVQMETSDSLSFKIFFKIPAAIGDTARIIDSLRKNYTPAGKRAFIE